MIFQLSCKPRCKPKKGMATTVNVLCYKSKTLGNGEHPLMICVCMDGKRKYKSLGVSVRAEHMNSDNSELALVKLMELFNHSSVTITKRYLGLRQEELLNTYDCLSF